MSSRPPRPGRSVLRTLSAGFLALAAVSVVPSPAQATPIGDLVTALASCADGATQSLTADLSAPAQTITVGCSATLDLAGHDLAVQNVVIATGETFTVTDSTATSGTAGVLTADASMAADPVPGIRTTGASLATSGTAHVVAHGSFFSAGIGGGDGADAGSLVTGGSSTVTATGFFNGAGVGGGQLGDGGDVTANDSSTITATGDQGAGIGGGDQGDGGDVVANDSSTITATGTVGGTGIGGGFEGDAGSFTSNDDSTVTATGDVFAAGIGGSSLGNGGPVQVNGGTVTASGDYTAVGSGSMGTSFGHVVVGDGGVLRLPSGTLEIPNSDAAGAEVEIQAGGVVDGSADATPTYATVHGPGQIANHGSIRLPTANLTAGTVAPISDHHYVVTLAPGSGTLPGGTTNPVRVYGSTFAGAGRPLPTPTRTGFDFAGWNTASDGSGTTIGSDTALPGTSADGTPHALTLTAQWVVPTIDTVAELATALSTCSNAVDDPVVFTLTKDLTDSSKSLKVVCNATLELGGFDVSLRNVLISTGKTFTVTDATAEGDQSGTFTADARGQRYVAGIRNTAATFVTRGTAHVVAYGATVGAGNGAGIGGEEGAGGTVESYDDSTITATGGGGGAGIGGGYSTDSGGTTTANDDSVITATGGNKGAGIGGGNNGAGGTTISNDNSTITATGGMYAAGIGGGQVGAGGSTTSNGVSTITATGGGGSDGGAGIGGGGSGSFSSSGGTGGSTTANGSSTVTATGGGRAAGIGGGGGLGGKGGAGGTTTSNDDSSIIATAGAPEGDRGGAGIGGGGAGNARGGAGGTTTSNGDSSIIATSELAAGIGGGSGALGGGAATLLQINGGSVTAAGGYTALGGGPKSNPGTAGAFGHVVIAAGGVLRLPSGSLEIPNSDTSGPEVTVEPGGIVTGSGGDEATYATVHGPGQIANHGSITLPTANLTETQVAPVTDHHYAITYAVNGGTLPADSDGTERVYAATYHDGSRTLPTPTRTGYEFAGWNTSADGTGDTVDADTPLSGSSADGAPHALTLTAQWEQTGLPVSGVTLAGRAEEGRTLTAALVTAGPLPDGAETRWTWFASNEKIRTTDQPTLQLRRQEVGSKIRVVARTTATGFPTVSVKSDFTDKVVKTDTPYAAVDETTHRPGDSFKVYGLAPPKAATFVVSTSGKRGDVDLGHGKVKKNDTYTLAVEVPRNGCGSMVLTVEFRNKAGDKLKHAAEDVTISLPACRT